MKIIKVNILLCLLALVLGSCEDFLESRDKGQVLEEKLFVNKEGVEEAMYGLYYTIGAGEVVAATYNVTMGNYVLINHGNGYYTIYMHASKLLVTPGQIVVEGDKIAEVGSTGRSTGPHLHFGVRKNGTYVNPMDYL